MEIVMMADLEPNLQHVHLPLTVPTVACVVASLCHSHHRRLPLRPRLFHLLLLDVRVLRPVTSAMMATVMTVGPDRSMTCVLPLARTAPTVGYDAVHSCPPHPQPHAAMSWMASAMMGEAGLSLPHVDWEQIALIVFAAVQLRPAITHARGRTMEYAMMAGQMPHMPFAHLAQIALTAPHLWPARIHVIGPVMVSATTVVQMLCMPLAHLARIALTALKFQLCHLLNLLQQVKTPSQQ